MEIVISLILGICLSAVCGFRVFIPPLIVSIFYKLNIISLPVKYDWVSSNTAILILSIATLIEISAYYLPVIDNFLDTISIPTSLIAGTLMSVTFINFDNNTIDWVLSVLIGGGSAVGISSLTSGIRLITTTTTLGIGNLLFSSLEWIGAILLSILTIFIPILSLILIILFAVLLNYLRIKRKNTKLKSLSQ